MKIVTLHTAISTDKLLQHLQQKVNPLFEEHRQQAIKFKIELVNDGVEVSQPEMYEGTLFRIEVKGEQLHITRNEHYVDDVNSLALESVLSKLYEDLTDDIRGVEMVIEG